MPTTARPCFVLIGSELLKYTGKTNNTLTGMTRGYNETTAASHLDAVAVTEVGGWDLWLTATCDGTGATLQDFTDYTKSDPSSHTTVVPYKIDVNEQGMDEDAYVYDDGGLDHFGPTFIHTFEVTLVAETGGSLLLWAVSNVVNDRQYWSDNNSEALGFEIEKDGLTWSFRLRDFEHSAASPYVDVSETFAFSGTYYIRIERESETKLTARIYTNSTYTTLFDKLEVPVTSGRRHRNQFSMNSFHLASTDDITLDIENFNDGETAYGYDVKGYNSSGVGLDDGTEGELLQDAGVDDIPISEGTAYLYKIHITDSEGNTNTEVGDVDKLYSYGADCYIDSSAGDAGQGLAANETWAPRANSLPR